MHSAIYRMRSDVQAVVHTHSTYATYATMFACAGEGIPAVHCRIADIGDSVPVADYAVYGSEEPASHAVAAFQRAGANGALLKNHGVITVGIPSLRHIPGRKSSKPWPNGPSVPG